LSNKRLDSLPPRILRFRLRLDKFDFSIKHVPGKELYAADTLSRAPLQDVDIASLELQDEVEVFIGEAVDRRTTQPDTIRKRQQDDPVCLQILQFCRSEWPNKKKLASILIPFWKERHLFSIYDNILLYNDRIVIPEALQEAILEKIHEGHQGVEKCCARLHATVW